MSDLDLKSIKHDLNLELTKRNIDRVKHTGIMNFIKYYVKFKNPKMMLTFETETEQLLGRSTPMGTEEYLLHKRETEGIQKGIKKGEAKWRHEEALEIARNLKNLDIDIANISKATGLPIKEIESL